MRARTAARAPGPFNLLTLSRKEAPLLLRWAGTDLGVRLGTEVVAPLSSSSYATAEVIASRVGRFPTFVRDPQGAEVSELRAYHRDYRGDCGARSVLMRRPDAATRSICHVHVDATQIRLDYETVAWSDDGPVLGGPGSLTLAAPTAGSVR